MIYAKIDILAKNQNYRHITNPQKSRSFQKKKRPTSYDFKNPYLFSKTILSSFTSTMIRLSLETSSARICFHKSFNKVR